MKKFAAALLAVAVAAPLATPAMAQPGHNDRGHNDRGHAPAPSYKNFRKGEKFDYHHARNYQQVDYRRYKRLKAPPRGYHYVRSGNDVLLITAAGIVAGVTTGVF